MAPNKLRKIYPTFEGPTLIDCCTVCSKFLLFSYLNTLPNYRSKCLPALPCEIGLGLPSFINARNAKIASKRICVATRQCSPIYIIECSPVPSVYSRRIFEVDTIFLLFWLLGVSGK